MKEAKETRSHGIKTITDNVLLLVTAYRAQRLSRYSDLIARYCEIAIAPM
jgi:hypothetical protein